MKAQLAHEVHNRQDKAYKPAYREEMAPGRSGSWSGIGVTRASGWNYIITILLKFTATKPIVAEALRSLIPDIDLQKLANAVRSAIGNHRSTVRSSTGKLSPAILARETRTLYATACKTVPGRFLRWHDNVPDTPSTGPLAVPPEFHPWLHKMVPRHSPAVTPPSASSAPPSSVSSAPMGTTLVCQHCHEETGFEFHKHLLVCPALNSTCPHCKVVLKNPSRAKLDKHIAKCPHAPRRCPYCRMVFRLP